MICSELLTKASKSQQKLTKADNSHRDKFKLHESCKQLQVVYKTTSSMNVSEVTMTAFRCVCVCVSKCFESDLSFGVKFTVTSSCKPVAQMHSGIMAGEITAEALERRRYSLRAEMQRLLSVTPAKGP